ncbi:MAG: RsmE family RNA methyltransferase [Elusimicrobiota bacterium]|jgi:16S rRNA (uracil1498-N3)-methyltransferase
MPRFFIPPENIRDGRFFLSGSEARHAIHVLRKKSGDTLELFDGKSTSFTGRIESVTPEALNGILLETRSTAVVSGPELTLYQALLKGPKWDWLIEKVCELGVRRLVPVETARTIVKTEGRDVAGKVARWRRIALAAAKQCGRADMMVIETPQVLSDVLAVAPSGEPLRLIPWEKETSRTIRQACQGFRGQAAQVFIGPEGGWEEDEVNFARRQGCVPVSLGPTLLRAETAGIVSATLALHELREVLR